MQVRYGRPDLSIDPVAEYPEPWTDEIERRVRRLPTEIGVPARA